MKQIMKKAWEIAKEAAKKFGGRAVEYIAEALRMAWAESRKPADITERIEELTRLGFNRWQKNGMDRMYINASALGLSCSFYKSGNISYAEFNGKHISNNKASGLWMSKTYIDLIRKTIVSESATLAAAAAELIGVKYSQGDKIIRL